jgi:hypothetical protein
MKAILYKGTKCKDDFFNQAIPLLRKYGFKEIKVVCWTRSRWKRFRFNYLNYDDWNNQPGSYDLAIGHSAGGFPLSITNAKYKIAINPFFLIYPSVDVVLQAQDDWLTIKDNPFKQENVIVYPGKHSTFPFNELSVVLDKQFIGDDKNS